MKKLIVLFLIVGYLSANWKPFVSIDAYGKGKFNLKRGVEYIEIDYHIFKEIYSYKNHKREHEFFAFYKIGKKPLKSFGKNVELTFKKNRKIARKDKAVLKVDRTNAKEFNLVFYNAYMLDSRGKIWILENKQDLIDMIKPIDTISEMALVLWLNGYDEIDRRANKENYLIGYKNSKNGYKVLESYNIMNKDHIGCIEYKYIYTVSRSGKYRKKMIHKKKRVQCVD